MVAQDLEPETLKPWPGLVGYMYIYLCSCPLLEGSLCPRALGWSTVVQ